MYNPAVYDSTNIANAALMSASDGREAGSYVIDLYEALNITMEEPLPYETFHLVSIGIAFALAILLPYLFRNVSGRAMRGILTFFWLMMVITEVVEKFVVGTELSGDILTFEYRWSAFPFQLCATGLWVLPFIIVMPEGKLRDAMMIYMGLYSFFGGLLVCLVPTTVFTDTLVVNIHTMIQHGSQVIVGVMMLVYNRKKLNIRSFLRATGVFLFLVGMALVMNEAFYHLLAAFGNDSEFNMFYISPHYNSELPVLGDVFELVPWGVYLTMYVVGFIIISFIIYFIAVLAMHLAEGRRYKREERGYVAPEDAGAVAAD